MPNAPTTNTPPQRDSIRESLETIVFVVVLVFLLKQFVVEAFVIPTGSMAETLYGYQKPIKCPECGIDFPLNSSREVEGDPNQGGLRRLIEGYCCPNCRYKHTFSEQAVERRPGNNSGDRVLVHKAIYHKYAPQRGDVVVFKFPKQPQREFGAQNYIKRLWGTGNETIAIWNGDLYVCDSLTYPAPTPDKDGYPRHEDLWKEEFAYHGTSSNDPGVVRFRQSQESGFADAGGFRLIRKPDAILDAMKRLVWDNDHQSVYLANKGVPPRWTNITNDWTSDNPTMPKSFAHTGASLGWIRYQHLLVDDFNAIPSVGGRPNVAPAPIDNFLGYNGEWTNRDGVGHFVLEQYNNDHKFWVGDLVVECQAKFGDASSSVTLELSKGPDRFQATFADGQVTLTRTGPKGKELARRPCGFTEGTHKLRFSNVDCSLRVWVDGHKIDFGTGGGEYDPNSPELFEPGDEKREGWKRANDIEAPVNIGAKGNVDISRLKIWRDTYFINKSYSQSGDVSGTVYTYYVQPGHYLCFGDNSAQSSDGRIWGSVPERLMLGKASFVFYPLDRLGFIK